MKEILENKEKDIREKSEQFVIAILEKELIEMEKRKPVLRRKGKGDPKYEILFKFAQESKKNGFEVAYEALEDKEKHAIITRLENRLYHLDVSRGSEEQFQLLKALLKKMEKELYGVVLDEDGEGQINFEKKFELEQKLAKDFKSKKRKTEPQ